MSDQAADLDALRAIDTLLDKHSEQAARRIATPTFAPATMRLFEQRVVDRLIVGLQEQGLKTAVIVERLQLRGLSRSTAYARIRTAQDHRLRCPEKVVDPGQRAGTMRPSSSISSEGATS